MIETEGVLSFDESEEDTGPGELSLDPGGRPVLDDKAASNRAEKANFALGERSPGVDVLVQSIKSGTEDELRRQLALKADIDFEGKKVGLIADLAARNAQKGKPISREEVEFFRGLSRGDLEEFRNNPDTFFEKEYAKTFMKKYGYDKTKETGSVQAAAAQENPEATEKLFSATQNITARKEITQSLRQDLEAEYKDMGFVDTAVTWAEQFVPFKSWYNMSGAVKDAQPSSILPGNNREEQYQHLHSLSPDEYRIQLKAAVDDIKSRNLLDAITFVQGAESYSVSDAILDNAFGLLDATDVAGLGLSTVGAVAARRALKGAAKGPAETLVEAVGGKPTAVGKLKEILKGQIKANAGSKLDETAVHAATGEFDEATVVEVIKRLGDDIKGRDPLSEGHTLRNQVPSIMKPDAILGDPGNLVGTRAQALVDTLKESATFLRQAIANPAAVERLGPEAIKVAVRQAAEAIQERFPKAEGGILDIEGRAAVVHNPAEKTATNTHSVTVLFGDKDKKLFESPQQATWYAIRGYGMETDQFLLKEVAPNKWAITVTKNLNETEDAVRDNLIEANRKSNTGLINQLLGKIRSAEDTVSTAQSQNRHIAIHAAQRIQGLVREAATPLIELSKDKNAFRDLEVILKANRDHVYDEVDKNGNKTGKKLRGEFYSTPAQLEKAYLDRFNRLPTDKEIAAYFNYGQLMDFDWVMRNLGIYRDKVRQGAENIKVMGLRDTPDGNTIPGEVSFEGVVQKDLPWGAKDDAGIWIEQPDGKGEYVRLHRLTGEQRAMIEAKIKDNGYKVIQVFNPMDKPLRTTAGTDETIHFMLTNKYSASKLEWKQLPYRPGVHVEYKHEWFVKQPKIRRAEGYHSGEEIVERPQPKSDISFAKSAIQASDPAYQSLDILKSGQKVGKIQYLREGDTLRVSFVNSLSANKHSLGTVAVRDIAKALASEFPDISYISGFRGTGARQGKGQEVKVPVASLREPSNEVRKAGTRHIYEGDVSILNVATQAEARQFAEAMDKARLMIKNGDKGADNFIKQNLPFTPKQFRDFFEEWVDEVGWKQPPKLHKDDKISFTFTGRNTSDEMSEEFLRTYENFENDIRNPYNLFANVDKKFGGTRDPDLPSYKQGTEENALLTLDKPKLIDPYISLNHSLGNVMRSRYLNDYKISAVEDWIQEFHDVMDVPLEELRRDPVGYLHDERWKTDTVSRERLVAAQNARKAIINFLGTTSEFGKDFRSLKQKLANSIFERLGKKHSDKFQESELGLIKDPITFARSVAFHSKLGFFNPIQLLMQAQSAIHVAALGGTHAIKGLPGASIMMRALVTRDPKVIEHMADISTKFGWKREHFLESLENLRATGFHHVEGETAWRDDFFDPKVITSPAGRFLDSGLVFFRQGEKFVRYAAWNTAYTEWRAANPTATLTNAVRNQILQRADTLSVNMTRASNAGWQKGLLSIPTQFLAYNMRLAEQFLGGRLTGAEKARAFLTYSLAYGVPVAGGAATAIPFYDHIRQYALEKGYDMDSFAVKTFMDGLIPALISAGGAEDYNISDRFGPGGIKLIDEIVRGEKNLLEFLVGPSGGIIQDIAVSTYPALRAVTSIFTDKEDEQFPWDWNDATDVARNISTLNNTIKAVAAWNTGRYVTKNEVYMDDVSRWDSLFMALTGLTPQRVTDAFLMQRSLKDLGDTQKEMKKFFVAEYRRGLKEAADGNVETAEKYLKRAKVYFVMGGWQPHQYMDLIKESLNGYTSLVDRINQDFWKKATTPEEQDARLKMIQKKQQN